MAYTIVHTLNDDVKFLLYGDVQHRMTGFDDMAFICQGLGTADLGLQRRMGTLCGLYMHKGLRKITCMHGTHVPREMCLVRRVYIL